jgi:hypothetical protein
MIQEHLEELAANKPKGRDYMDEFRLTNIHRTFEKCLKSELIAAKKVTKLVCPYIKMASNLPLA